MDEFLAEIVRAIGEVRVKEKDIIRAIRRQPAIHTLIRSYARSLCGMAHTEVPDLGDCLAVLSRCVEHYRQRLLDADPRKLGTLHWEPFLSSVCHQFVEGGAMQKLNTVRRMSDGLSGNLEAPVSRPVVHPLDESNIRIKELLHIAERSVNRELRRKGLNLCNADDLAIEVIVDYCSYESINEVSCPHSVINTIARRRVIDFCRKVRKEPVNLTQELSSKLPAPAAGDQCEEFFRFALEKLVDPFHREVFVGQHHDEYTGNWLSQKLYYRTGRCIAANNLQRDIKPSEQQIRRLAVEFFSPTDLG